MNPVVELPPFGNTINRKINLQLSDANLGDSIRRCWVHDTLYLSVDGWSPIAAIRLGSQPPRIKLVQQTPQTPLTLNQPDPAQQKPSSTPIIYNLQWLGSSEHADFLQGRLILLSVVCNTSALPSINLCFPMQIAGSFGRLRSLAAAENGIMPHHEGGDHVETGVLVAAACGGALGVLYVIVLAIFITSRLHLSKRSKKADEEMSRCYDSAVSDGQMEKNVGPPAAQFVEGSQPAHEYNATSYAAWPEDLAFRHRLVQLRNCGGTSSLPMRYLYSPPPFFLNDVLIVQTPDALDKDTRMQDVILRRVENKLLPKPPLRRRKVFFDPRYFDTDHLKHPTDEAEIFRAQIHCMINVTKSRLDKRRFLPHLEMIDEESQLRSPGKSSEIQTAALRHDEQIVCIATGTTSRSSEDLDAVVLQVRRPVEKVPDELLIERAKKIAQSPPEDWTQILKDEWGSNESLPKIPHRRRIQEVFQKNWCGLSSSRTSLMTIGKKSPEPKKIPGSLESSNEKAVVSKQPTAKIKLQSGTSSVTLPKTTSDDEDRESDKASSRSGTGSNQEKDSGIEDDHSDKTDKTSFGHKLEKDETNIPAMISRKKIVSANVGGVG